ncbi:CheR family methyltransferase [Vibrio variabilis]|uniref:CheR family methyltransferase n=1 Tax=Vibrio variabilis TaxID=990271 RepID=UPI000DD5537E|nr:protein-glutamate O-methyltransferase CheR [Vibrio variabilis]
MIVHTHFEYTDEDFTAIASLIYKRVGIDLHSNKKKLVYNRLVARLRTHQLNRFAQYIALLNDQEHGEWEHFINALTTNLTYFFREPYHFDLLKQHVRDRYVGNRMTEPIRIWCSACSTGEEAYSLAITMAEAFESYQPPVKILATDLNTQVLASAKRGHYSLEALSSVSDEQQKRFFSLDRTSRMYSVKPEIQSLVHFKRLNLMEHQWPMKKQFHAIFCRNVLIYFNRDTQYSILTKFANYLAKDALLFLGHSESCPAEQTAFKLLKQTAYRRV